MALGKLDGASASPRAPSEFAGLDDRGLGGGAHLAVRFCCRRLPPRSGGHPNCPLYRQGGLDAYGDAIAKDPAPVSYRSVRLTRDPRTQAALEAYFGRPPGAVETSLISDLMGETFTSSSRLTGEAFRRIAGALDMSAALRGRSLPLLPVHIEWSERLRHRLSWTIGMAKEPAWSLRFLINAALYVHLLEARSMTFDARVSDLLKP